MSSLCLFNPRAGRAKEVVPFLREYGISYTILTSAWSNRLEDSTEDVIIVGGDGSVNGIIQQLPQHVTVGILPCGKANDFAYALGLPMSAKKAFDRIQRKNVHSIDLVSINGIKMATGGSFGFVAHVCEPTRYSNLGNAVYVFKTLQLMLFGYPALHTININGQTFKNLMLVCIMNQSKLARHFTLAPGAKNNDGVIEIGVMKKPRSFIGHIKFLLDCLKGGPKYDYYVRGKQFTITSDDTISFNGDGETLTRGKKFDVRVVPKSLKVYQ